MERGDAILDGARRQLPVAQQIQLELSKVLGSQLVRRLMEVRSEVTNGADVVADRAGAKLRRVSQSTQRAAFLLARRGPGRVAHVLPGLPPSLVYALTLTHAVVVVNLRSPGSDRMDHCP